MRQVRGRTGFISGSAVAELAVLPIVQQRHSALLDHLVGADDQSRRECEFDRLSSFKVDERAKRSKFGAANKHDLAGRSEFRDFLVRASRLGEWQILPTMRVGSAKERARMPRGRCCQCNQGRSTSMIALFARDVQW